MVIVICICEKFESVFELMMLQVFNESGNYNVLEGFESYFCVVVVFEVFVGKGCLQRYCVINGVLKEELVGFVYVLVIDVWMFVEWVECGEFVGQLLDCFGGDGLLFVC